jgi:hypothetical protein
LGAVTATPPIETAVNKTALPAAMSADDNRLLRSCECDTDLRITQARAKKLLARTIGWKRATFRQRRRGRCKLSRRARPGA